MMRKLKRIISLCSIICLAVICLSLGIACDKPSDPVYEISLSKSEVSMVEGGANTLVATVKKDGVAVEATPNWKSSNESVVTVDEKGKLTAVLAGTATVTATYENVSASCEVTVNAIEITLTLSESELVLYEGESATLSVSASDGGYYEYAWSSSNDSVASVANGVVTALSEGNAVITASYKNFSVTCNVLVEKEEIYLVLNKDSLELKVGEEGSIEARVIGGSLTEEIIWSSSDETVATVDKGVVTALSSGSAVITVKLGEDYSATCQVTVTDNYELIFPMLSDLFVNESIDLGVIAKKNGNVDSEAEITYEGEGVTFEKGIATVTSYGEKTITVSYAGESRSQTVNVYNKVSTKSEFEAIKNDMNGWYKLANDIDVQGGFINSIGDNNYNNNTGFGGIFDGNGYAIMNYIPSKNGTLSSNTGLFAVLNSGGIIRNLKCINATIKSRSAALVAHAFGTIENCFVDATIDFFENSANNPTAAVVTKFNKPAKMSNVIAVVRLSDNYDFSQAHTIGAMVGRSYAGAVMQDCYSVSPSELKFYAENALNFDAGEEINCGGFNSLDLLYSEVTAFEGWSFVEGCYPTFGNAINVNIDVKESGTAYKGAVYSIDASANLPVVYALAEAYEGVTLSENGILTLSADVDVEEIVITVKSLYNSSAVKTVVLDVAAEYYSFTMDKTEYSFNWLTIDGTHPEEELAYTLYKNGSECQESITFTSSDESVAKVENGVLVAVGSGKVTVTISLGDLEFKQITVECLEFIPVYTVADFNNIDNDKSANYILMNDIDFADENGNPTMFQAFSSYNTAVGATTTPQFTGVFDGNGYALRNIIPGNDRHYFKKDFNYSIFGVVGSTGVIRNLAVYAQMIHRSSVISNYMLGTIENCYVEALIVDSSKATAFVENAKNGIGLIAQEARTGSKVTNCITKLIFAEENTNYAFVSGIAAVNYSTMTNCSVIVDNEALGASIGICNVNYNPGTIDANTAVYASEAKLATEGKVTYDANIWSISQSAVTLVNGCTIDRPVEDNPDTYTFTMDKAEYSFIWLTTDESNPEEELAYTLLKNGSECQESITFTSSDESVAKVENGVLVAVGSGKVTITISLDILVFKQITVECLEFIPVYTVADFNNIDNDKSANYILMNDLDFADENGNPTMFQAFSSYNTAVGATTTPQFTGVFDGNGYALRNIIPGNDRHYFKKDFNYSIFGVVGSTGVIRNLAVYAQMIHRSSVISNYMLGTIENCYVEALIVDSSKATAFVENEKNGIGLIAQEARTGSKVTNCVAKLIFAEENTNYAFVSGIAAVNYSTMTNCSVIVDNETLGASIGICNINYNPGTIDANTAVYASEAKLATEGKVTYDANIWSISQSAVTLVNGCTIDRPVEE